MQKYKVLWFGGLGSGGQFQVFKGGGEAISKNMGGGEDLKGGDREFLGLRGGTESLVFENFMGGDKTP